MNYLNELKNNLINDNKRLLKEKNDYLSNFQTIDLYDNILKQIDIALINYYKENINNYGLTKEEILSIQSSLAFFIKTNDLGIDLSCLLVEDQNIINLKKNIILLVNKSLEYKNTIVSNIDLFILNNSNDLNTISKIESLMESNLIDLDTIYDLINTLEISNKLKVKIYKEIYIKYIDKLKEHTKKDTGIRISITEEDKKLEKAIEDLKTNLKELETKINDFVYGNSEEINERVSRLKINITTIIKKVQALEEKMLTYVNDKGIDWEEDIPKEEIELEFQEIFNSILQQYNEYFQFYADLLRALEVLNLEIDGEKLDNYPPIIFWFGNNQMINDDNYKEVEEILAEFDAYPENNFYSGDFLPVLEMLKRQLSFIYFKEKGFSVNTINEVRGIGNALPFREIKMRNGRGGGTARIYYDTIKSEQGRLYIIVYVIKNKTESYDKEGYQKVEGYLKSKIYQKHISKLLDDPGVIEQFRQLEKYILRQVYERVGNERLTLGTNGGVTK